MNSACDAGERAVLMSRIYEVLTDLDFWATLCGLVALVGLYCYLGAA